MDISYSLYSFLELQAGPCGTHLVLLPNQGHQPGIRCERRAQAVFSYLQTFNKNRSPLIQIHLVWGRWPAQLLREPWSILAVPYFLDVLSNVMYIFQANLCTCTGSRLFLQLRIGVSSRTHIHIQHGKFYSFISCTAIGAVLMLPETFAVSSRSWSICLWLRFHFSFIYTPHKYSIRFMPAQTHTNECI